MAYPKQCSQDQGLGRISVAQTSVHLLWDTQRRGEQRPVTSIVTKIDAGRGKFREG